jgi:hypothetical protein
VLQHQCIVEELIQAYAGENIHEKPISARKQKHGQRETFNLSFQRKS